MLDAEQTEAAVGTGAAGEHARREVVLGGVERRQLGGRRTRGAHVPAQRRRPHAVLGAYFGRRRHHAAADRCRPERLIVPQPTHCGDHAARHELADEPYPALTAQADVGAEIDLRMRAEARNAPAHDADVEHLQRHDADVRAPIPTVGLHACRDRAPDQTLGRFEREQDDVRPAGREKGTGHLPPVRGRSRWCRDEVVQGTVPSSQAWCGRHRPVHEIEAVHDGALERAA